MYELGSFILQDIPSSKWDICDYLDAEFNRRGTIHFDFGTATSNWTATTLHFSSHGEGDQKTVSVQKLEHYRGCPVCLRIFRASLCYIAGPALVAYMIDILQSFDTQLSSPGYRYPSGYLSPGLVSPW